MFASVYRRYEAGGGGGKGNNDNNNNMYLLLNNIIKYRTTRSFVRPNAGERRRRAAPYLKEKLALIRVCFIRARVIFSDYKPRVYNSSQFLNNLAYVPTFFFPLSPPPPAYNVYYTCTATILGLCTIRTRYEK